MKYTLLFIFLPIISFGQLKKGFKSDKDEFTGSETITHRKAHDNYPYIVKSSDGIGLYFQVKNVQRTGYLNIKKITFLINGKVTTMSVDETIKDKDALSQFTEIARVPILDPTIFQPLLDDDSKISIRIGGESADRDINVEPYDKKVYGETIELYNDWKDNESTPRIK